jgi:flagellar basal-body rod modification protein FlgD
MVGSIAGISTTSAPSPSSPPTNELGRDSFVRLLLTQLQSQDPTAPQSSEDFVAQLAQFTSVELLEKQSGHLEALLVAQAANNQIGVSSLVGKDVSFAADSIITTSAGEQRSLKLDMPSAADNVTVTVKDADGRVVRTMNIGARAAGQSELTFDGLGDDGEPLPAGTYALSVTATAGGNAIEAMLFERGAVEGVSFINGIAELLVAGRKVRLPDVIEVNEPVTPPEGVEP